jgi:hypothetical protein
MQENPPPSASWKVLVFHVTDQERQQEILVALRDIDDLDLVALGTRKGRQVYVVIDCPTSVAQVVAQGVVGSIDPGATVSYLSQLRAVPSSA